MVNAIIGILMDLLLDVDIDTLKGLFWNIANLSFWS